MKILQYITVLSLVFIISSSARALTTLDVYHTNLKIMGIEIICPDADLDGFSDSACGGSDCNDSDDTINPDAIEICNGVDDNCNFFTDEGFDEDSDGFTTCNGDCNDEVVGINPGIEEWCFNGIDDDCDGMVDCDDEDDDNDLVDDVIEDGAPGGDGNNDGIPDSWQAHVISIPANILGPDPYVTLETDPQHKLFNAKSVNNPSPSNDPAGVSFPLDFFEFEIELLAHGQESFIILYLPDGVEVNTFYKYGPTPDNPSPHWYNFHFDGETGAQFLEDRIVLRFVDGKRGDDDITVNGEIIDPGGPGFIEILEESVESSDGCSLAGSGNKITSNNLINLIILLIPMMVALTSLVRRRNNI